MKTVDIGLVIGVICSLVLFVGFIFTAYSAVTTDWGKEIGKFIHDVRVEAEK